MSTRMLSGKMTKKGQITIPAALREKLHLQEGDRLEFVENEQGKLSITPITKGSIFDAFGILKSDQQLDLESQREYIYHENSIENLAKDQVHEGE